MAIQIPFSEHAVPVKFSITLILAMCVGISGATSACHGQDRPASNPRFGLPSGVVHCFPYPSGPISHVRAEQTSSFLTLEIAVRPAESDAPTRVMLNGYFINKGDQAIEVLDYPANSGIAMYGDTSLDLDEPPFTRREKSLYPNSWILRNAEQAKRDPEPKTHVIMPGERSRVLSIPIDELYDESMWDWNWRSHLRPPGHPRRSDVFIWFDLRGQPDVHRSNTVNLKMHRPVKVLRVKSGELPDGSALEFPPPGHHPKSSGPGTHDLNGETPPAAPHN